MPDHAAMARELIDRKAIRDCVNEYAQAVDRHDGPRIAAVFHPDAIDDHGRYVGGVPGFIDWVNGVHAAHEEAHAHNVTTHSCAIDGDSAHAESYIIWVLRHRGGRRVLFGSGRYLDRLERRDGAWRIALRRVVREMRFECDAGPAHLLQLFPAGRWDKEDPAAHHRAASVPGVTETAIPSPHAIERLWSRQAIIDCVARAARAADRADSALLEEVALPAAWRAIVPEGAVPFARTHNVSTHLAEYNGQTARAVSDIFVVTQAGADVSVESRRLDDRLMRTPGGWKIAARHASVRWRRVAAAIPLNPEDGAQMSRRDRGDLSYQRPLTLGR